MTIYFLSWFVKNKLNRGCSFWQIFSLVFLEVIDPNAPTKMAGIVNKVCLQTKKIQNIYFTFHQKHKKICLSERGFCGKRKKLNLT